MIQSGKFDSFKWKLKNSKFCTFFYLRLIELSGVIISILGLLLLTSLITYSPDDPNFIFPDNTKFKIYWEFREAIYLIFFSICRFNSLFYTINLYIY